MRMGSKTGASGSSLLRTFRDRHVSCDFKHGDTVGMGLQSQWDVRILSDESKVCERLGDYFYYIYYIYYIVVIFVTTGALGSPGLLLLCYGPDLVLLSSRKPALLFFYYAM